MKRSPMARTGILRVASFNAESKPARAPKQKTCKACREKFTPERPGAQVCSVACSIQYTQDVKAKKERKAARAQRSADKLALDQYKTIPQLIAELQIIFNEFIRLRDDKDPCICCGKWPKTSGALTGGQWDAAHWRSRGSAGHLRFNEDNVHKALKDCNKYGHTDYRGGLIAKIGLERTEAVQYDETLVKWTREWLEAKKVEYRAKIKELQA